MSVNRPAGILQFIEFVLKLLPKVGYGPQTYVWDVQ